MESQTRRSGGWLGRHPRPADPNQEILVPLPRPLRPTVRRALLVTAGVATVAATLLTAPAASAKADPTGDFAVTVNGVTSNPAPGKDVKIQDVAVSGRITVRGVNVTFTIDPATLGVYDYTLTGAPSPDRMVTQPTVVFASKAPRSPRPRAPVPGS